MAPWPGMARRRGQLQTGGSRSGSGFYYGDRRVLLMDTEGTEVVWSGEGVALFTNDVLYAVFSDLSKRGEDMIRSLAPVGETGDLQESCYAFVDRDGGRVLVVAGATAKYAIYQELGTSRHAASPFIRPTFDYLAAQVGPMLKAEAAARGGGGR